MISFVQGEIIMTKMQRAAHKAWKTRRARAAAHKAWKTIRKKYTQKQISQKATKAAHKAWRTRRKTA